MVALTAAMAFTFTACNDDSTSAKEPSKVSKSEDLSKDCEDGEEALVGDKEVLYTCKDGKWVTEEAAKSSASKPKSSSSKVEDSDEDKCDEDLENCDEDEEENGEEEEVKSSSSKKKPTSASSDEGGSGSGGSTSKCTANTETQTCIDGKLVDNDNVEECCTKAGNCTIEGEATKFDKTTHFCANKTIAKLCNGKKYTPQSNGECREDGNYYYNELTASYFEDLRDNQVYKYVDIDDVKWMAQNLRYAGEEVTDKNVCARAAGQTSSDCDTYGRYYQMATAQKNPTSALHTSQGICPSGWHIPSLATEFTTLVNYVKNNYSGSTSSDGYITAVPYPLQSTNYSTYWKKCDKCTRVQSRAVDRL